MNTGITKKYKIQVKICNARRYFLESLDLLFPYSAQPYINARSSITTKKKEISYLAERQTHDH